MAKRTNGQTVLRIESADEVVIIQALSDFKEKIESADKETFDSMIFTKQFLLDSIKRVEDALDLEPKAIRS